MTSLTEIGRYRGIMSQLVSGLAVLAKQTESWLHISAGQSEPGHKLGVDDDRLDALGIVCALLLRKMRLHAVAVLQANKSCNAHSLGVQMRPALECAGQLALIIHSMVLDPEHSRATFWAYLEADYYDTTIRATEGKIRHDQLLEQLASIKRKVREQAAQVVGGDLEFDDSTESRRRGSRKLRHIDKVAKLAGGGGWYRYLSDNFCHGDPAREQDTWRGGVVSVNTPMDEFACAGMMDYLANQMAVMIAYSSMWPEDGRVDRARVDNAMAQLESVRAKTKKHRTLAVSNSNNTNMYDDAE